MSRRQESEVRPRSQVPEDLTRVQQIHGRQNVSSDGEVDDHDDFVTEQTSSTPSQHLLQLATTFTARRRVDLIPPSLQVAKQAENSLPSEIPRPLVRPLSRPLRHETIRQPGALQQFAQPVREATRFNDDITSIQRRQSVAPAWMRLFEGLNTETLLTTASCADVVALKVSQRDQNAEEEQLTCSTCMDSLPLQAFPMISITPRCFRLFHLAANQSFLCKSCISHSIGAQLSVSGPESMNCPLCHQWMSHDDIKRWAEPQIFEEYDRLATLRAIQQDSSSVRCCEPGCEGVHFHDGDAEFPIATCQVCGIRTCFRHSHLPWHEGLTCDEFEDPHTAIRLLQEFVDDLEFSSRVTSMELSMKQSQDASTDTEWQSKHRIAKRLLSERRARVADDSDEKVAKAVAETSKPCPNCKSPVERRGGCKHMTCRCGYDFCYGCLASWKTHMLNPCPAERHPFGLMPMPELYRPLNREIHARVSHLTQNPRPARAPQLPSPTDRGGDDFRARFGVPEALDHSAVPSLASRPPPAIIPPRFHPFATRARLYQGVNGHPEPQDQQISLSQFMESRAAHTAQVNRQSVQTRFGSGPGARGHFTRALEEALVESGRPRANGAFQRVQPHQYRAPSYASVRNPMESRRTEVEHETRMRDLARQYVREGRMFNLSALETFRFADQDFAMRYQGLQHPFDPDFTRAHLLRTRIVLARNETEGTRRAGPFESVNSTIF